MQSHSHYNQKDVQTTKASTFINTIPSMPHFKNTDDVKVAGAFIDYRRMDEGVPEVQVADDYPYRNELNR